MVVDLRQVGRDDLSLAGGKGANLGELIRARFPVPPGFVVTTRAYRRCVVDNHLEQTIAAARADEPGSAAAIRMAFERAPMPAEVEREIRQAYARLGKAAVAVRSSATAEDLPQAAFAGQQESFLNVNGADALVEAVKQCWASLWTDRAIAYRERQRVAQTGVELAVVVQRMVAADVAGVLFTAHPVTGARNEVVIDASPGLGEAVVSGLVTPDHYVLRKRRWWGWQITERRRGRREVVVRPRADGAGTEHITPSFAEYDRPLVSRRDLRRLARLGVAIQRCFGAAQDVEWALAEREPFILQARPITALPDAAPPSSLPVRVLASLTMELLPARPYPLEVTTWGPGYVISALLGPLLATFGLALQPDHLFVEEDGVIVRLSGRLPVCPTPAIVLAPVRIIRHARRHDPRRWRDDPLVAEAVARARKLEARHVSALTWTELLQTVEEALDIPRLLGEVRIRYMPGAIAGLVGLRVFLGLVGRAQLVDVLLSGLETRTMEANRELERLAAQIRSDPELAHAFASYEPSELSSMLGARFGDQLRAFLNEYGHREAGGTLLVSQATWKETPAAVLGILKGLAMAEPRAESPVRAWQTTRDELLARPLLRVPPLRSAFLGLLARARTFPEQREDTRFYATMVLPALHRTLVEMGARLAAAGVLDAADDVFHLKLDELQRIDGTWPPPRSLETELRTRANARKRRRAELESTPLVDPRLLQAAQPVGDALLRGTPGGPGVAEGAVRVVRNASEFGRLQPGDVLVAPYTNPAWTPLFQRASAVVVDSGGPMSHAAIVAREYGLPAVMATIDGTRRLSEGQRVRVDGTRGLVLPANET